MKDQFVPYELAVKLKELGFDEPCIAGYRDYNGIKLMTKVNDNTFPIIDNLGYGKYCHQNKHVVKAPLWQQAFDWFSDKGYGAFVETWINGGVKKFRGRNNYSPLFITDVFETYKEARLACLKKLIELKEDES